jgi:phage/conjugal plasmid C-4 type zinc finger TraR family protein
LDYEEKMTDPLDIASEREQLLRDIALEQQRRNAGLTGKTVDDSAVICENDDCGAAIPQLRRVAMPGCRFCIECQQRLEQR